MSDSAAADSQPLIAGRYRLLESLGQGGFGDTYLARDEQLPSRRQVLVKRLRPIQTDDQTRASVEAAFLREAKVLEDVGRGHPQIPELFAYFQEEGAFWLVQEYVPGTTLDQLGQLEPTAARQLLLDLLPVLEHLHGRGLLHRDIKPANIILREGDRLPVLIDFGAVRETMAATRLPSGLLVSTIVIGTQGYMPPEQAAGRAVFSSDLYALALTLITLLTGRHPQELPTDPGSGAIRWQEFTPDLDPALAAVLARATEIIPAHRYPNAREMLAAVQALGGSQSSGPAPAAPAPDPSTQATWVVAPAHPARPPAVPLEPTPPPLPRASGGRRTWLPLLTLAGVAGTGLAALVSHINPFCLLPGSCPAEPVAEAPRPGTPAAQPPSSSPARNPLQLVQQLTQPRDLESLQRDLQSLEQLLPQVTDPGDNGKPQLRPEQLAPLLQAARQRLEAELQNRQLVEQATETLKTWLEAPDVRENRQKLQQLQEQLQSVEPDSFVYRKSRQLLQELSQLKAETPQRRSPGLPPAGSGSSMAAVAPAAAPQVESPAPARVRRPAPGAPASRPEAPLWESGTDTSPSGSSGNSLW